MLAALALTLATALVAPLTSASPLKKRAVAGPVIDEDFPDPGLMRNSDGGWWAYSTSTGRGLIPYANSGDFKSWGINGDALRGIQPAGTQGGIWAPDVRELGPGSYIMYYSVNLTSTSKRCIGFGTADNPSGPFNAGKNDLVCDDDNGGVIDAASFLDTNGDLYLLWKVDGNSVQKPTPIKMRKLNGDGQSFTADGEKTLISNDKEDNGLVEAPSLITWNGWYYLFFSSATYSRNTYDVSYAVSQSAMGDYTKVKDPNAPLLKTDTGKKLYGPGHPGAVNVLNQYVNLVFAALRLDDSIANGRGMWTAENLCLNAGIVKLDSPC